MNKLYQVPVFPISKSDWDMIASGEKWVLFQDEIDEVIETVVNEEVFRKIHLQDKETNEVLGEATIISIFSLLYNVKNEGGIFSSNGIHLPTIRNKAIKSIYFEWCTKKGIKANYNEGWFKSKKFSSYLDKINWGGNYVIILNDIIEYKM